MKNISRITPLVFLLLTTVSALGGSQAAVPLKVSRTVAVPGLNTDSFLDPIKCDSQGDIYMQAFEDRSNPFQNPIVKISPDGGTLFFHPSVASQKKPTVIDFAPTSDGGLALVTANGSARYLQFYNDQGKLVQSSALQVGLSPLQIAVSPSGQVLLSGVNTTSDPSGANFTGIYNRAGVFEQAVHLSNDIRMQTKSMSEDPEYRQDLVLSYAQSSSDGDFVLARLRTGGPIHVISATGSDILSFMPTLPNGEQLTDVKEAGNDIAALTIKKAAGTTTNRISQVFITLYGLPVGNEIARFYTSSAEIGSALACYQQGTFTFLSSAGPKNQVELVEAVPESGN